MQKKPSHPLGRLFIKSMAQASLVGFFSLPLQAAPIDAAASDAQLAAQRPPLEQKLKDIESERFVFQKNLAKREEECLKRFFSASCLEVIREDHLREMRGFDLRREETLQVLRDIDAELRSRNRTRRAEDRQNKQPKSSETPARGGSS